MNAKLRTEVTIETHAVTIIRVSRRESVAAFCEICRLSVPHFSVLHSAAALQLSEAAVFQLIQNGEMHSMENATGALLICGGSLSDLAKEIRCGNEQSTAGQVQQSENKEQL